MDSGNPVLDELGSLSDPAKQALLTAHQAMAAPPMQPAQITPQMKQDASPQQPTPPPMLTHPGMQSGPPALPQPPSPQIHTPGLTGTTGGDTAERQRLLQTGSGISQIHNPLLRGLARTGDIIGDVASTVSPLAHVAMQAIPGTEQHHQLLVHQAGNAVTQDIGNDQKEAQTANLGATTAHTQAETAGLPQQQQDTHNFSTANTGHVNAETNALEHPAPKWEVHDTEDGPILFNQASGVGQHLTVDGQPVGAKIKLTPSQPIMGPDGKPHTYMLDDKGNKKVDLGVHYERPITVNTGENHQFAEQERGRGLLDKAEGAYRTAQQGANTMRDMVASARGGNKMSAQVLPLEGALAITTAQGVHRINRTEVDQYAGAGNLYDRIAGEVGKLTAGQPIPPNILDDIEQLTAIQEKGAYGTYKGAYDSATRRYKLNDEKPLDAPSGGGSQGGNEMVTVQIPGQPPGQIHASQKAAFLAKYPNAKVQ